MPLPMPLHEGRQLPHFTVSELDLPEVRTWDVNREYFLVMKVEMTGLHNAEDFTDIKNEQSKLFGEFRMVSLRALDNTPISAEMLENAEFDNLKTRVLSGEFGDR